MRRLGQVLMVVGAVLGVFVGASWLVGFKVMELPLLVLIGTAKLAIIGSLGMMGAGATMVRLSNRGDARIGAGEDPPPRR